MVQTEAIIAANLSSVSRRQDQQSPVVSENAKCIRRLA
jgi:hypothetical protein